MNIIEHGGNKFTQDQREEIKFIAEEVADAFNERIKETVKEASKEASETLLHNTERWDDAYYGNMMMTFGEGDNRSSFSLMTIIILCLVFVSGFISDPPRQTFGILFIFILIIAILVIWYFKLKKKL